VTSENISICKLVITVIVTVIYLRMRNILTIVTTVVVGEIIVHFSILFAIGLSPAIQSHIQVVISQKR